MLFVFWTLVAAAARPVAAAESPGGDPHGVHALVGGRIVAEPGRSVDAGTIVVRDGWIEAVGADVDPPADARVWDATGLTIYAGLIEPYLQSESGSEAEDWPAVVPERRVVATLPLPEEQCRRLREAGYTAALIVPGSGVWRGTSALVQLSAGGADERLIRADVAQHVAFARHAWQTGLYPMSRMGAVALVRQTLIDAAHDLQARREGWRRQPGRARPGTSQTLAALEPVVVGRLPVVVEAPTAQLVSRIATIFGEFDIAPIVVTGGCDAYRWLDPVAAAGLPLIVSLNVPPAPRWESEAERRVIDLEPLRHWYAAPENPARLHARGIRFGVTGSGLSAPGQVRVRLRQAVERGLPDAVALAAVTTEPARVLGVAGRLGVIAEGAVANLTVTDGSLFDENTEIVDVWIDGQRYDASAAAATAADVAGNWELTLRRSGAADVQQRLELRFTDGQVSGTLTPASVDSARATPINDVEFAHGTLGFQVPGIPSLRVTAAVDGRRLRGLWRSGSLSGPLYGLRRVPVKPADAAAERMPRIDAPLRWPPLPEPAPRRVLVKDATIWTMSDGAPVGQADLLCGDGLVTRVGRDLQVPAGTLVIDGNGMHVTPGLIDTHSHAFLATASNECSNSCTAEVRIADELDAGSPNLYRQLAGGVTTSMALHGSCNPIGGQSAVIKLRWGRGVDELLLDGAPPGIKFALGENPKRSSRSEQTRFPGSRLGVEQLIRERFLAALEYQRRAEERRPADGRRRRDLQLEALLEVVRGERHVHCHAYRQDEMLMLMRVAEEFGFVVRAFHHGLEAYKVADEIRAHGASVSLFTDWWATKHETADGIPYNAALLAERGVLATLHSDNAAIARRLNLEAAKVVRYGGVGEVEALAMVTRDAARQLGIERWVGTLEPGKHADFVVWSGHPLAASSRAEQTWIDGRRTFDRQRDRQAREAVEAWRLQLLDAAAKATTGSGTGGRWRPTFGRRAAEQLELERGACVETVQEER